MQAQALKLWKATLSDPTPGWGLSVEYLLLSPKKPTRALFFACVDNWEEALQVHQGNYAEQFEKTLVLEIATATAEEASALYPDAEVFQRLIIIPGGK